ncbi:MAG: substrate-binding domain-containing protein [Myxococcota bacterium]
MKEDTLISAVRERRTAARLSQSDLADRAGISRQAVSAIEAGRQIPSTTLALRLARALGSTVDDLFRLPGVPVVDAALASSAIDGRRVVLGRVDGDLVAHRVTDDGRAADGTLLADDDPRERVPIELFADQNEVDANVLVAGCAPLLGILAERLGRRYRDVRATLIPANSSQALAHLGRGHVHLAGVHLAGATEPTIHVEAAKRALPDQSATLVHLACWKQGLVVAKGNPLSIQGGSDLLRPDLRWVLREEGSGAQRLLERVLRQAGGSISEPHSVAADHAAVGQRVRWGTADVGVAIEAVALAEDLDFIPLAEERFDLIVPAARLDSPAVRRFIDLIDAPAFRSEAASLRGYDLTLAGHASSISAP